MPCSKNSFLDSWCTQEAIKWVRRGDMQRWVLGLTVMFERLDLACPEWHLRAPARPSRELMGPLWGPQKMSDEGFRGVSPTPRGKGGNWPPIPGSRLLVYLWGAFLFHTSLPNLSTFLPFLIMSSATIINNSESNTAHPLESFHSSMDYQHFESSVIQPFLLQAKLCDSVNVHHCTSLSFAPAPGHPSLDGLSKLLSETDYNNTTSTTPLPAPSHSDVSSTRVEGYFSRAVLIT